MPRQKITGKMKNTAKGKAIQRPGEDPCTTPAHSRASTSMHPTAASIHSHLFGDR
jgi:hypothetical protein